MKKVSTYLCLAILFLCNLLATRSQEADLWALKTKDVCSFDEQKRALEWLDAAIERSKLTTDSSKQYLQIIERVWEPWENFMWTRRNPSRPLPHPLIREGLHDHVRLFEATVIAYHAAGRSYDALNEQIKKMGGSLASQVAAARAGAMKAVWYALCEEYATIDAAYEKGREAMSQASDRLCRHERLRVGHRWWQSLVSWVPRWIRTVFARFDDGYTAASADCFGALMVSQQASVVLWETLERARMQWLTECRDALLEC